MNSENNINKDQQKDPEQRHVGERILSRKMRLTKSILLFENFWLKLWGPILVIALFLIAALYGLWPLLSPPIHRLILALFVFGLIATLVPFLSLRWPRDTAALKRLDRNSTLPHQPAQAFKDKLDQSQGADNATRALWLQFKDRLVGKIKKLKVAPPHPRTYDKDPYAIRMLIMLAVAIGLFIQGGNIAPLLSRALTPPPMIDTKALRIDAWITPPPYTLEPPILIADGGNRPKADEKPKTTFTVPQNSILTIRINGKNAQRVSFKSENNAVTKEKNASSQPASFNKKPAGTPPKTNKHSPKNTKEFQIKLINPGPFNLTLDEIPLKGWSFQIKEDLSPIIGLVEMPSKAQSGALKLKYRVADDYGVIAAKARVENVTFEGIEAITDPNDEHRPLGDPPEYELILPERGAKEGLAETFKDLTSHPWAGLTGDLYLIAEDEGANKSKSPFIKLTLPEHKFEKPMAKLIIRIRKQLILRPKRSRYIARSLEVLLSEKKYYDKDLTLYVGLNFAANRLSNARSRAEKEEIASLLYDLARHVEDGDLSKAESDLRKAQEQLRKALEKNAPDGEIKKRIDELRQALQKYMQALAKQQQKQNAEKSPQNKNNQSLDPKDFEQMLKTIEELAKSGSKDLARQMLNQMQNMLENLQTGKNPNQQQQNQDAKDLEKLGKILQEQQKLMDKTFQQRREAERQNRQNFENSEQQQGQENREGEQGKQQNAQQEQSLEQQQESLQKQLEKLMEQMKGQRDEKSQSALENAEKAMGRAKKDLKGKNLGDALSQEGKAMDQLRRGMQQMAKEMQGSKPGQGPGKRPGGRDPLGRRPGNSNGLDTSDSTKVPEKIDIQRAREILKNLQEKLSDPNRPAPEINYFERLLKRF